MRIYTMAQLWATPNGQFDCHFTRRVDDKNAPPRIRSYRYISPASVRRFVQVSGGYQTAYAEKRIGG